MKNPLTVRPVGYQVEYSYAGFEYRLTKTEDGWEAAPLPGQPYQAQRHCHAAIRWYLADYNEE